MEEKHTPQELMQDKLLQTTSKGGLVNMVRSKRKRIDQLLQQVTALTAENEKFRDERKELVEALKKRIEIVGYTSWAQDEYHFLQSLLDKYQV